MAKLALLVLLLVQVALSEVPEALQDLQTEFYLPYSVTEDVDFSLNRPGGFGCYQWSTDAEDIVKLQPTHTDYVAMCGSKLEFQIIPGSDQQTRDFKIIAENVDLNSEYGNQDIPSVIEYTIHMRPVARIEVLGLKTELTAGSDPVPFGVAGYDAEDNEFDTLDGLQIGWFVGGKRDVAEFEKFRQVGPIVKVVPLSMGKGAVIAVLNDPNYQNLEPAIMEFSVKSNLMIEPDGVYMLEGARVPITLVESVKLADGTVTKREMAASGPEADFSFEVKESDIVRKDKDTNNVTGVEEGETTIFVRNNEGEIIKGMPIRVTKAHTLKVTAYPNPESKQLILENVYEIKIEIFDRDEHPVYPSENILCKTTFPKQLEVLEVSENGLWAKVKASHVGVGKVKASLRSVLTDEDEELEILPHVKGSTDFEVYESVLLKPKELIMPWDDNIKPTYELKFSATGGGKVYTWSRDKEDFAVVDSEGKVTTHTGPGSFKVKAAMAKAPQNFDEVTVHVLPVSSIALKEISQEISTSSYANIAIQMFAILPETDEEVLFTDCADIPYEITLSDNINFEVDQRSVRGQTQIYNACASFQLKAKKAGAICKVSITYKEPTSGRTLRTHTSVSGFDTLESIYPKRENPFKDATLVLAIGSSSKVAFKGGPLPWHGKPSGHFKQIEIDDPEIVKVVRAEVPTEKGTYSDLNVYDVTCMQLGSTKLTFVVGNNPSATNTVPSTEEVYVKIECSMPHKVSITPKSANSDDSLEASVATGRIMSNFNKDLQLILTVKNQEGTTFDSIESLNFEFKVSDKALLTSKDGIQTPKYNVENVDVQYDGKPFQVFHPTGKEGNVEISVKLAGYVDKIIKAAEIENPPALPKILDDDDEDSEDDQEFAEHHHSLTDSIDLFLTTDEHIKKVKSKY